MRDGHLLAEANPEQLLIQHNALTLEDVFLKLCMKDMQAAEAQEDAHFSGDGEEEGDMNAESFENVWLEQQVSLFGDFFYQFFFKKPCVER